MMVRLGGWQRAWMDVETFKELQKVLSLTYDEAVEISLEELKTMVPVRVLYGKRRNAFEKNTLLSMANVSL